jgi:succinate-semialdehyde dehydrogenase/glutarate-semialdehyde dehydrogenase
MSRWIDSLRRPDLVRTQAFVGGAWRDGRGAALPVHDPATGRVLATVAGASREDADAALAAAAAAFPAWSRRPAKERAAVLMAWHRGIVEHAQDLAMLMTMEQGKPLAEAKGEVAFGASFVSWYAEEAKRVAGEILQTYAADRRVFIHRQPIGVVVAITPWNFPSAMVTRKVAPAIAAGCTVVLKPSEETPLCALALAALAEEAGVPKGVVSVLPATREDAPALGEALLRDPRVRKLSFTGSTATGKHLMRLAADNVLKLSLELGGNAPLIVFDDADLDRAVAAALAAKFRNAGQTCTCANRLFVQAGIHDRFVAAFTAQVAQLKVGPGTGEGVTIGPLINERAVAKVRSHVSDAVRAGASIALGGRPSALGPLFFEPTVLTGVAPSMRVCVEETFGPVAPIVRFDTEEEAVRLANDSRYGLAGYFFTRDVGRAIRVSEALELGAVGVNEAVISSETVPIGGVKESGIGREGAHHGIDEFLETKQVTIGGLAA